MFRRNFQHRSIGNDLSCLLTVLSETIPELVEPVEQLGIDPTFHGSSLEPLKLEQEDLQQQPQDFFGTKERPSLIFSGYLVEQYMELLTVGFMRLKSWLVQMIIIQAGEGRDVRMDQLFLEEFGREQYRIPFCSGLGVKGMNLAWSQKEKGSRTKPVGHEINVMCSLPGGYEKEIMELDTVRLFKVDRQAILLGKQICQLENLKLIS